MKKLYPLIAVGLLASACNVHDNDRYNNRTGERTDVAPGYVVTPAPGVVARPDGYYRNDGTYVARPDGYYRNDGTYVARPDGYYRNDGTYVVQPAVVAVPGHQPTHADDALSDRSLGNSRGTHNQPMTHLDADSDGDYDFVPDYNTRGRAYYYTY